MATVNLMQIYEDIYAKRVSHCALCYQSDSETRLVKSVVLKKVVKAMKYSDVFLKNQKLCYMCEARVVSVGNFIDTLHLALEVQRVFMRADMSGRYRKKIMAGSLKISQNDFTKFRNKMRLYQTNTLVLDCLKYPKKASPSQPIPPAPPDHLNSDVNLTVPVVNTVLQQLNPLQQPYGLFNPSYNVVTGLGGSSNLYMVPTLTIDASPAAAQTKALITRKNNKKRPMEDIDGNNKTPKYSVLPTIVDCRTDDDAFIKDTETIELPNHEIHQHIPEVVKHPIRTGSAVDWEDKIPMEVISFMDDEPPPVTTENRIGGQPLPNTKEIIDLC